MKRPVFKTGLFASVALGLFLVSSLSVAYVLANFQGPTGSPGLHGGVIDQHIVFFGRIDVEGRVRLLFPTQTNQVIEVPVYEGEQVKSGTVLVKFDDRLARPHVDEAAAAVEATETDLSRARELPAQQQARLLQQQAVVEATAARLTAGKSLLGRKRDLRHHELIGTAELLSAEEQVHELEALLRVEQNRLDELKVHDVTLDCKRLEAELKVLRARLAQAQVVLEDCSLKAPCAGRVLRIHVGTGETCNSLGEKPAVEFCPDAPQIVRAEVEQEFAGRVAAGQVVEVEDEADPHCHWSGRIVKVSEWLTRKRTPSDEPLRRNDVPTLECLISLNTAEQLRIGQRVRVSADPSRP